jgi:hypothetical protein
MLKWRDIELSGEDRVQRNRWQDEDFCRALRDAIYAGTESCPEGVSAEPGTKNPISSYQPRD